MNHEVHLGVTGLRRSGKTVFLTALIYQLEQLGSASLDSFENRGITLHPARIRWSEGAEFPYERYLAALRQHPPRWPEPTIDEYTCSLEIGYEIGRTPSIRSGLSRLLRRGNRSGKIHLHLHDYPGEYLLDVELAELSYEQWCARTLSRLDRQAHISTERYRQQVAQILPDSEEPTKLACLQDALRASYATVFLAAMQGRMEMLQPAMTFGARNGTDPEAWGRRALPFVPLPPTVRREQPVFQENRREYNDYVQHRVRPFVKRLAHVDRQVVLVDVLRVLKNGVDCFNDTRECLAAIMGAYRYASRYPFMTRFLPHRLRAAPRIAQVMFVATKADHALRSHRSNMRILLDDLVRRATGRIADQANGQAPERSFEYLASLRSTTDTETRAGGRPREALRGRQFESTDGPAEGDWNPGVVPDTWPDPMPNRRDVWPMDDVRYDFPSFSPACLPLRDGATWPHLNLDRILWRLLADCFGTATNSARH